MSTEPSTENLDLPTNLDGETTEESSETTKNIAPASFNESIDNTPDNPNATSDNSVSQDSNSEKITGDISDNSVDPNSIKDEELNKREIPSSISQVINSGASSTDFSSFLESISTFEHTRLALQSFLKRGDKFSTDLKSVSEKMESILKENTQLHLGLTNLTEENKQQSLEIASLNERLAKIEEMSKSEFDELIQETLKQDAQSLGEDERECQGYIDQAKLWQSKTEALSTLGLFAICRCSDRMKQCDELMEQFKTETPSLYKSLQSRYESLQLSNRMLDRLREPLELLSKSSLPPEHLFRLRMSDLVELLRSPQIHEAEAKKILAKELKEAGDARYKSIREWRDSSEKLQKQWLHFIEKKLLPALDGINDGKPYAENLVIESRERYQTSSHQDQLTNWLKTYSDLEAILLEALNSLEITMMQAEAGQPVDYDRHEPIGTEPDPKLEHEHIKEVTRNGYEYKIAERSLLLRNAQVVVVKNK